MQFDWFLSVLEQKWLRNHETYYIGAAELPFRFPRCTPLLGWRYLYIKHTDCTFPSSVKICKDQLISGGNSIIFKSPKK